MLIGKKGNRQGIVFAPYIIQSTTPAIVEGMRNWKRKSRIEKIYKIKKPTEE